jgi:hypothetical protein
MQIKMSVLQKIDGKMYEVNYTTLFEKGQLVYRQKINSAAYDQH